MNEDVLLFFCIFIGLLIFGGGLFGFLFWATSKALNPIEAVADKFMNALKDETIEQAYDTLLTKRFRDLTSPGAISKQLRSHGRWIEQWRWGRVETVGVDGFLNGQVTFTNGESKQLRLALSHIDNRWLVDDIDWIDKG